ncbi:Tfp pilus assembly protein PilW [Legionella massiliensis]|uniref:Tfp pilus assembly protein PilW n=1 Tax=Legionella massiliensis TaxID=1034943 RepID=A0A078KVR6_9GAMM|nr:prepilin-type N-terminal cleavage/methylation domain-containing protein [Legionella massiliensis]CDZ77102.1 Tfp pilus assembly protein PilW [Legionella massiliensis]CEE12840.1 hypothetical protein BN1094_01384 [Legionella massiliensis]
MKKQEGISLLELLISLFVASLLMTLMLQQYLITKRQYREIHRLLERSIELQMVTDLIRASVRMAGFTPCGGINSLNSIDRRNARTGLNAILINGEKSNSLQINKMGDRFATVMQQLGPTQLLLQTDIDYEEQEAVLIADCFHAEVQQIAATSKTKAGTVLTFTKPLAFDYLAPIYLGEWVEERFFIQKNKIGDPALFYKQKHAEELTNVIQSLAVKLSFIRGKIMVEVNLGLQKNSNWLVRTVVRAG